MGNKPSFSSPGFSSFAKRFLLLIGLGLLIAFAAIIFAPDLSERSTAEEYLEGLQAEYENDTYGGATPEETLELFIAALEAEDIELASKYFLPEDREEILEYLSRTQKNEGDFNRFAQDVDALELSKREDDRAFFIISNEANVVDVQVVLKKNKNNVWKITEL